MHLRRRRFWSGLLLGAAALMGWSAPLRASSPDFYGIKMNSENHARDLAPDELSLFPVRRGFDKNVYAYGHVDTQFDHSRAITFNIFNNTDNDLLTEKAFREFYVVLRNGERYRLNEPGMTLGGTERVQARGNASLRAEFGGLNVTKEQIEMVVCSFDMGKVKIVLLPIAVDPPPPLPKSEAERLLRGRAEKDAPGVYPNPEKERARVRGENEIRRENAPSGGGRFPVMDLPIFSWLKSASATPSAEQPKPQPVQKASKAEAAPETSGKPMSKSNISTRPTPPTAAPAAPKPVDKAEPVKATPADKKNTVSAAPAGPPASTKPVRRGLFETLFPFLSSDPSRRVTAEKTTKDTRKASPPAAKPSEKEYFWKPRDLAPIRPVEEVEKEARRAGPSTPKGSKESSGKPEAASGARKEGESQARPFYMPRALETDAKIPAGEPVSAVSSPQASKKAPELKPQKKLRAISPRQNAQVVQINRPFKFIVVNAGTHDGVQKDMVLNIYRHGKIIAKAIVRKATEDASAALLMKEWAWEDVAIGDPVSLY